MAWQMVIELVSGLAIGFGIGYGIDAVLGTKPIFMVLFILLGFAAGVKVMLGTAAQMQEKQGGKSPSDKEEG
jgi:ATP synthase protein I